VRDPSTNRKTRSRNGATPGAALDGGVETVLGPNRQTIAAQIDDANAAVAFVMLVRSSALGATYLKGTLIGPGRRR
jgi:hypothetical protein